MNTPETPKPDDTELRAVVRKMRNEVAELQRKDMKERRARLSRRKPQTLRERIQSQMRSW